MREGEKGREEGEGGGEREGDTQRRDRKLL